MQARDHPFPLANGVQATGISGESFQNIRLELSSQLLHDEVTISVHLRRLGYRRSRSAAGLDTTAQRTLSAIIRRLKLDIVAASKLVRGETSADPRPNKALCANRVRQLLQGYEHTDLIVKIIRGGVEPRWSSPPPLQGSRATRNHQSCQRHLAAVLKSIREGQNEGKFMVVDEDILDQWPQVVCSPLGAVEKKGVNPSKEVRVIHDLSFPCGSSTNACFDKESAPAVEYEYVTAIADRIENIARTAPHGKVKLLKGDVKQAFRHLMMAAGHVHWMAAHIPEARAVVVDISSPFGWSGSPPFYSVFGRGISWVVNHNSPATVADSTDCETFFGYEWVDDHIMIEEDRGDRLALAEATLRHAMLAILGPRSINDKKFSTWQTRLQALGLNWDTEQRTVSMPDEKVTKALTRVQKLLTKDYATKTEMQQVLGSLRHLCTCLRAARPFYQRLQWLCNKAPRFDKMRLSADSRLDLLWFSHVLRFGALAELPLRLFCRVPPTGDVHMYMDASNIQVRFDEQETQWIDKGNMADTMLSINVREHLCVAFAAWVWGEWWTTLSSRSTLIVQCWSDNRAAVAWTSSAYSNTPASQEINRAIGLAEAVYNIRIQVSHLPGVSNTAADAASRA